MAQGRKGTMKSFRARGISCLLIVVFIFTATGCQATPPATPTATPIATPVPTTVVSPLVVIPRTSLPLLEDWRFAIDKNKVGEQQGWANPVYDDSAWTTVTVPHTWNVMSDYADYSGLAWYRRAFTLPAESKAAHLRLRFEGVFYLARVWLNGQYLGEHEGGYTPFEFDVSDSVKPGEKNIIAVEVDNVRAADRIPANLSSTGHSIGGTTAASYAMYRSRPPVPPLSLANKSFRFRTSPAWTRPIRQRSLRRSLLAILQHTR